LPFRLPRQAETEFWWPSFVANRFAGVQRAETFTLVRGSGGRHSASRRSGDATRGNGTSGCGCVLAMHRFCSCAPLTCCDYLHVSFMRKWHGCALGCKVIREERVTQCALTLPFDSGCLAAMDRVRRCHWWLCSLSLIAKSFSKSLLTDQVTCS
jgi:hypothetical protein